MRALPAPARLSVFSIAVSLTLLPGWLTFTGAFAQEDWQCEIMVREIVAENTGQGLSAQLKDIGKDLEKLSYTTFRLEQTHRLTSRKGEASRLDLLGKNRLVLSAESFEEGKIRLKVKLTPESPDGKKLEMPLRIPDGGTFIIAGPQFGDGVLFLAITARMSSGV